MDLIQKELLKHGFECYTVGGAVRDMFLGIESSDIDYATNATPEEMIEIFKEHRVINMVGKSFKVLIINGTEVATYRKDRQQKNFSAKHCKPVYADTIEEDLARRDLTINAMALGAEGTLIDPFNGRGDLEKGIIRMVGDPYERINQDPCRIVRACRFLALIEGTFEANTFYALQEKAHFVKRYVDPERIRLEILKAMKVDTPSLFFSALYLIGVLQDILPEMSEAFGFYHGIHHKEDVAEHLLQAGDNISKKFPLLRLAAFLHDIGKPTAFKQNMDGSFCHHEHIGARLVRDVLKRLKFTNKEVKYISNLVYMHMRQSRSLTPAAQRRLQKKLAEFEVDPRDFVRLKIADRQANMARGRSKITPIKELLRGVGIRTKEEPSPLTVKDLALRGGDIIELLGIQPGPRVGILQKALLEFVLEEGPETNNKEVLYEQLKRIATMY